MQSLTGEPDCKTFYEKTLAPMSVRGELMKKEKTDKYYLLYVKNENESGKETIIQLLKNKTGKNIFMFALDKNIIIKVEGETALRVAAPTKNGLDVRIFPDLCE